MHHEDQKVILVLLDAFRCDYISRENTPNLFDLIDDSKYYKKIVPSFGFCERTEILVGKSSLESGYFTALGYDPKNSPYKDLEIVLTIFEFLESKSPEIVKKVLRRFFWYLYKKKPGTFFPFNIPFKKLSDFRLTEDGFDNLIISSEDSIYNKGFGVFKRASTDMSSAMIGCDESRLNDVLENLGNPNYQFFPVYVSKMDFIGHYFGTSSNETFNALKEVDEQISNFVADAKMINHKIKIILCGDHGMTDICKKIDIEKKLKDSFKEEIISNKLNYFIDSTLIRFWFNDENLRTQLKVFLHENFISFGDIVHAKDYEEKGIPKNKMYGDMIFLCHSGVIISPDFFNSKKNLKGMHGYIPKDDSNFGFCMIIENKGERVSIEDPTSLKVVHSEINRCFEAQ
tara:strand:+ start:889 stop:2088 length:1200 start_codon:yes stop_codon:yes gene_type:complete